MTTTTTMTAPRSIPSTPQTTIRMFDHDRPTTPDEEALLEKLLSDCIHVESLVDEEPLSGVGTGTAPQTHSFPVADSSHDVINNKPPDTGSAESLAERIRRSSERSRWRRCPHHIRKCPSFAKSAYHLLKSEVGLILLLLIYSMIGAGILCYIEGRHEIRMQTDYNVARRQLLLDILNVTDAEVDDDDNATIHNPLNTTDSLLHLLGLDHHDEDERAHLAHKASEASIERLRNSSSIVRSVEKLLDDHIDNLRRNRMLSEQGNMPGMGPISWTFWGALYFCGTVFTTVGYGNIVPVTSTGRIVTMIYALFGIPLCLIVLTKVGRLLTRGIKVIWSNVRRFYYTGSCRRVRRMIPKRRLRESFVQRIAHNIRRRTLQRKNASTCDATPGEDPEGYVPYEIDDKFNLPPLVAILIAFTYILLGALMYTRWERHWTYMDAVYFTFISLSTVGFGDVVPEHPKFFLASSVYLLIGLALIAMTINVVMEWVHDTIKKATIEVRNVGQKMSEIKITPGKWLMAEPPTSDHNGEELGLAGLKLPYCNRAALVRSSRRRSV